jgi:hypothetical protein
MLQEIVGTSSLFIFNSLDVNRVSDLAVPRFSQRRIISGRTSVTSAVWRFLPSRSTALARSQIFIGSK